MAAAEPDAGRGDIIDPGARPDLAADADVPCDAPLVPAAPAQGAAVAHRDARSTVRTLEWIGMQVPVIDRQDDAAIFLMVCPRRYCAA